MMPTPVLTLIVLSLLLLFLLVIFLVLLLVRTQRDSQKFLKEMLKNQVQENQALRNQLLAPDVQTLSALNQVTGSLPDPQVANNVSDDLLDLGEAINYEENLAMRGYTQGDLGYDLESAGWASPVVKRDGDDPIAYES